MTKKSYPLRPTLVTSVIVVVLLTVIATGLPTYYNTKKSINLLWNDLAQDLSHRVVDHTENFFRPANRLLPFTTHLVESGNLPLDDPIKLLSYCRELLQVSPDFCWATFSSIDGTFLGTYRVPGSNEIQGEIRVIDHKEPINATLESEYTFEEATNTWTLKREHRIQYDPRTRPFWIQGLKMPEGSWSEPYQFADPTPIWGSSYIVEQKVDGKFVGFWTIDFYLSHLIDFLNTTKIGLSGEVAILSKEGVVVGASKPVIPEEEIPHKDEPMNALIKQAWDHFQKNPNDLSPFMIEDYMCYMHPLSKELGLPWNILTLAHEEDFLAPIRRQAERAFELSIILVTIFGFLGALFFGFISKKLKKIAYELHQIGNFTFSTETFSDKVSFIKEVNMMNIATDQMKLGLNSLTKYVPLDLVTKLMQSGHSATLGGEKQQITVLFTDLANFTQIAEQTPPDTLLEILGEYFQAMNTIIEKHHGTVDKYVGDSIMAFWGAPSPDTDHSLKACKAALAMQEKFQTLWKKMNPEHRSLLKQRIGINTGVAIVGNIGAPDRMDYTAIGDQVNLASRLENLNKFYSTKILIGEATAAIVKEQMLLRPIEKVSVKGKAQASLVYELLGFKKEASAETLKAIAIYEKGLTLFQNRQFAEAALTFAEANVLFGGNDSVSQILEQQAKEFQLTPPPENWNGTIVMREK